MQPANLRDLVAALAASVADAQSRLDAAHARAVLAFLPVCEMARERGLGALAESVAPSRGVLAETRFLLQANLVREREAAASIQVQPLNLGYEARFASRTYSRSTLQFTVAQS